MCLWIVELLYEWDDMLYEWDDFSEFYFNQNYESVPKRMIKIILVNFIWIKTMNLFPNTW